MGRVWPRHRHRGRPLNSVVIRHEIAAVKVFVGSHIAALRAILLAGVLAYVALTFAWFNLSWRTPMSHQLGAIVFVGSVPWSMPWIAYERELQWLIPASFGRVTTALIVGLGFGLNAAIAVGVTWHLVARLTLRGIRVWKRS